MDLSEKDISVVHDIINNFFQNSIKTQELEFRIGKFKEGFKPYNDPEIFYNIKNIYASNYPSIYEISEEYNFVNEIILSNGKNKMEKVKKIIKDEKIIYIIKSPIRMYNIFSYDVKLSLENEKIISEEKFIELSKNKNTTKKTKKRWSFKLNDYLKLDLTEVIINNISEFHIEIEIENVNVNTKEYLKDIFSHLTTIIQYKQKNYYLISNNEKTAVLNEYQSLVKNKYFVGAQPETLHFEHFNLLKKDYLLTYKADGERGLLLIDKNSNVYVFDNNLNNIIKTNIKMQNNHSTILDIEIIRTRTKIIFLIFDILVYESKDLRDNVNYNLYKRLELINNIQYENDFYKIKPKQYIDNFQIGIDLMINEIDSEYLKDGLIFVPINEPYPSTKKWKNLLKWKPSEKNTIDFWIKEKTKLDDGIKYELYINNPENKENNLELFKPNTMDFDSLDLKIEDWSIEDPKDITWETIIYNNEHDLLTNQIFKGSTVVEFYWSFSENRFIPLKTRWDKLQSKTKWGNNINVAKDIWKNIKNPVKLQNLKNINNNNRNTSLFLNMRKFHNYIKNYLYKYIAFENKESKTKSIIELCSGRGGDINKWIHNNFSKVLGFDISKVNISECYNRLEKLNDKNLEYKFVELDLTNDITDELNSIIKDKYNSIVCNFGIHYMFKNENSIKNFINICENYLEATGLIVLTYIDKNRLKDIIKEKSWLVEKNSLIYNIKLLKENKECWGNELEMYLNGDNIMSVVSNEYLVDMEELVKLLGENYNVVETKNFGNVNSDNFKLEDYEKLISSLYSYIIIQKGDKKSEKINVNVLTKKINKEPKSYLNEIEYNLSSLENLNLGFKLFKLNTNADFEFVNNLQDYNNSSNFKYLEIEYKYEKLIELKINLQEKIKKDEKLILKIFNNDEELSFEAFYLYMDNDYDITNVNIENIDKLLDIMIGSIKYNEKTEETNDLDLNKLKVEELKNMARKLKITVSGKKSDLIDRINVALSKN
jgi:hypothetical protein